MSADTSNEKRAYPCAKCGIMRSEAEGGAVFTVCDACWDLLHKRPPNVCEHGNLARKCDSCELVKVEAELAQVKQELHYEHQRLEAVASERDSLKSATGLTVCPLCDFKFVSTPQLHHRIYLCPACKGHELVSELNAYKTQLSEDRDKWSEALGKAVSERDALLKRVAAMKEALQIAELHLEECEGEWREIRGCIRAVRAAIHNTPVVTELGQAGVPDADSLELSSGSSAALRVPAKTEETK